MPQYNQFSSPCFDHTNNIIKEQSGVQLVETLRYNPGGGFGSRCCHWNFSLTLSYDPAVDSAAKKNKYGEYFLVG